MKFFDLSVIRGTKCLFFTGKRRCGVKPRWCYGNRGRPISVRKIFAYQLRPCIKFTGCVRAGVERSQHGYHLESAGADGRKPRSGAGRRRIPWCNRPLSWQTARKVSFKIWKSNYPAPARWRLQRSMPFRFSTDRRFNNGTPILFSTRLRRDTPCRCSSCPRHGVPSSGKYARRSRASASCRVWNSAKRPTNRLCAHSPMLRQARLVLVSRPDVAPLKEAARSSHELQGLGINNQTLVINGLLQQTDDTDSVTRQLFERQQDAMQAMPESLPEFPAFSVPLRSYNLSNIANIRRMLSSGQRGGC